MCSERRKKKGKNAVHMLPKFQLQLIKSLYEDIESIRGFDVLVTYVAGWNAFGRALEREKEMLGRLLQCPPPSRLCRLLSGGAACSETASTMPRSCFSSVLGRGSTSNNKRHNHRLWGTFQLPGNFKSFSLRVVGLLFGQERREVKLIGHQRNLTGGNTYN